MGFMDEMMAAKRTADSHASLKALDSLAASEAAKARALEIDAAQNRIHNSRMLQLAIDDKIDKLDETLAKHGLFFIEQLSELLRQSKSKSLQVHLMRNFNDEVNNIFSYANPVLSEIGDKREAAAIEKKWRDLVSELAAHKQEYENSVLFRAVQLENKRGMATKEKDKVLSMLEKVNAALMEADASKFAEKLVSAGASSAKSANAAQHISDKDQWPWQALFVALNEAERADLAEISTRYIKTKKLKEFSIGAACIMLTSLMVYLQGVPEVRILGAIGSLVSLPVAGYLGFILWKARGKLIPQSQGFLIHCRAVLPSRVSSAYSAAPNEFARIESELESCITSILREFPEFEKFQSEAVALHQNYMKTAKSKQTELKSKIKSLRK